MTPDEARQAWLDALRSGEYWQARLALRRAPFSQVGVPLPGPHEYCATGVAAEVLTDWFGGDRLRPVFAVLAETLKVSTGDLGQVVKWNDDEMLSFGEIADRLETQVFT